VLVVWEGWRGLGSGGGNVGRGRGDGVNHELFFIDYHHCGRELGLGEEISFIWRRTRGELFGEQRRDAAHVAIDLEM